MTFRRMLVSVGHHAHLLAQGRDLVQPHELRWAHDIGSKDGREPAVRLPLG